MTTTDSTVLFLCTGNYYRSRFCEIVFNHLASGTKHPWRAQSRGLATELGINNPGPLSIHTRHELDRRDISYADHLRMPLPVTDNELASADIVIALQRCEHRPLVEERHPAFCDKVEYWDVADVGDLGAPGGCAEMERMVRGLVERLGR